jgi:diaminopimelate epimerase
MLRFTKMNGAGNDFVMVDNRDLHLPLDPSAIAHLCDRHRGIGADGLIAIEPASNGADFRMRYFNADGGEAEMCGNGARCFARFAARTSGKAGQIVFDTLAGVVTAQVINNLVRLEMSQPKDLAPGTQLVAAATPLEVHFINTGVPHAVIFVDDLAGTDVLKLGAAIRYHDHFAPRGTNANFVHVESPGHLAIRTYERGVEGETLACGTGVCAAALMHAALHGAEAPVHVRVRGGDTLEVGFEKTPDAFRAVTLTGPADFVFDGEIALPQAQA